MNLGQTLQRLIRNVPFVTITFMTVSVLIYHFHLLSWVKPWTLEIFLLHPFLYANDAHIVGNMVFGLFIIGFLIESWMVRLKRIVRYALLLYCYLVSLTVVTIWGVLYGYTLFGSSGLVLAGLSLIFWYSLRFRKYLNLNSWNVFAIFGAGLVSSSLVQIAAQVVWSNFYPVLIVSFYQHLLALMLSLYLISWIDMGLKREWKLKLLQAIPQPVLPESVLRERTYMYDIR